MDTKNIYGKLPVEIIATPKDAQQFSPLLPGSLPLETCAEGGLDGMAMLAPFGTFERRYALALTLRALLPGASFTVMAPNDKGGTRLKKELLGFGCDVVEEARRHHRICTTTRPPQLIGIDEAITDGAPRLLPLGFWSQPGVFSWDRLDTGSKLLADHLPVLLGRGADLGCGFGYLSRVILISPSVQHLALVDIDYRAIDCAKRNIDDKRASFLWTDIHTPKPELTNLDFIVMNPPFHDAGIENQTLGQQFITRAHALLRASGVCWMVANRHLPYEKVLNGLYKKVTLKAEDGAFKIYEAIK